MPIGINRLCPGQRMHCSYLLKRNRQIKDRTVTRGIHFHVSFLQHKIKFHGTYQLYPVKKRWNMSQQAIYIQEQDT